MSVENGALLVRAVIIILTRKLEEGLEREGLEIEGLEGKRFEKGFQWIILSL